MEKLNKCCICSENIEILYKLPFRYLIGLADEYEEEIGYYQKRTKRQHEFIFRNIDAVESVFEVGHPQDIIWEN